MLALVNHLQRHSLEQFPTMCPPEDRDSVSPDRGRKHSLLRRRSQDSDSPLSSDKNHLPVGKKSTSRRTVKSTRNTKNCHSKSAASSQSSRPPPSRHAGNKKYALTGLRSEPADKKETLPTKIPSVASKPAKDTSNATLKPSARKKQLQADFENVKRELESRRNPTGPSLNAAQLAKRDKSVYDDSENKKEYQKLRPLGGRRRNTPLATGQIARERKPAFREHDGLPPVPRKRSGEQFPPTKPKHIPRPSSNRARKGRYDIGRDNDATPGLRDSPVNGNNIPQEKRTPSKQRDMSHDAKRPTPRRTVSKERVAAARNRYYIEDKRENQGAMKTRRRVSSQKSTVSSDEYNLDSTDTSSIVENRAISGLSKPGTKSRSAKKRNPAPSIPSKLLASGKPVRSKKSLVRRSGEKIARERRIFEEYAPITYKCVESEAKNEKTEKERPTTGGKSLQCMEEAKRRVAAQESPQVQQEMSEDDQSGSVEESDDVPNSPGTQNKPNERPNVGGKSIKTMRRLGAQLGKGAPEECDDETSESEDIGEDGNGKTPEKGRPTAGGKSLQCMEEAKRRVAAQESTQVQQEMSEDDQSGSVEESDDVPNSPGTQNNSPGTQNKPKERPSVGGKSIKTMRRLGAQLGKGAPKECDDETSESEDTGKSVAEKTVAEKTVAGKTVAGKTVAGKTVAGKTVAGKSVYPDELEGLSSVDWIDGEDMEDGEDDALSSSHGNSIDSNHSTRNARKLAIDGKEIPEIKLGHGLVERREKACSEKKEGKKEYLASSEDSYYTSDSDEQNPDSSDSSEEEGSEENDKLSQKNKSMMDGIKKFRNSMRMECPNRLQEKDTGKFFEGIRKEFFVEMQYHLLLQSETENGEEMHHICPDLQEAVREFRCISDLRVEGLKELGMGLETRNYESWKAIFELRMLAMEKKNDAMWNEDLRMLLDQLKQEGERYFAVDFLSVLTSNLELMFSLVDSVAACSHEVLRIQSHGGGCQLQ